MFKLMRQSSDSKRHKSMFLLLAFLLCVTLLCKGCFFDAYLIPITFAVLVCIKACKQGSVVHVGTSGLALMILATIHVHSSVSDAIHLSVTEAEGLSEQYNVPSDSNCTIPAPISLDVYNEEHRSIVDIQNCPVTQTNAKLRHYSMCDSDIVLLCEANQNATVTFDSFDTETREQLGNLTRTFVKVNGRTSLKFKGDYAEIRCGRAEPKVFTRFCGSKNSKTIRNRAMRERQKRGRDSEDEFHIIMDVHDSISRPTFVRAAQEIKKMVHEINSDERHTHRVFVFHRYSTVSGSHTLPNLTPLFSGHYTRGDYVINMIFPALRAFGYVTAYSAWYSGLFGAFNWPRSWFDHISPVLFNQPLSYVGENLRPMLREERCKPLEVDATLNPWAVPCTESPATKASDVLCSPECSLRPYPAYMTAGNLREGIGSCFGGERSNKAQYDWSTDFMTSSLYPGALKFLYQHNMMGHRPPDDMSFRQYEALAANSTRQWLKNKNTIIFQLSDHGNQHTARRNPFLLMYVPTNLLRRYPNFGTALHQNQGRLISTFDLHETLKHILTFPNYSRNCDGLCADENSPEGTVSTSISLFYTVPVNRSCVDAGIMEGHCACGDGHKILPFADRSKEVQYLMKNMVDWVNEKVTSVDGSNCSTLSDATLVGSVMYQPNTREYQVRFRVKEGLDGGAHFQIIARQNLKDLSWQIIDRVQKTRYAVYESCSDPRVGAQWCICQPVN